MIHGFHSIPTVTLEKWRYSTKWIRYLCSAPRITPLRKVSAEKVFWRFWVRESGIVLKIILQVENPIELHSMDFQRKIVRGRKMQNTRLWRELNSPCWSWRARNLPLRHGSPRPSTSCALRERSWKNGLTSHRDIFRRRWKQIWNQRRELRKAIYTSPRKAILIKYPSLVRLKKKQTIWVRFFSGTKEVTNH